MSWYKLGSKTDKDSVKKIKYKKIIAESISSFKEIVSIEEEEGVQFRFVTTKSFNAISVLEFINNKYDIEEIYIAVYRMNLKSVGFLKDYFNKKDIKGVVLLSNFFRDNKKYERWCEELISFSKKNKNITVKFCLNHAKVFICKTKCKKHIVFEGSGNLSDNARIEQYLFENNKETYKFHKKWISSI